MTSPVPNTPGNHVGRRLLATVLGVALVCAIATGAAQARPAATNLSLVAYSTPAGAFGKIIPAFQATAAGKDVTFKQSYGASGSQAAAVHNGLPADVVNLSLAPDVSVLSQAGLVGTNWNKDKYGGMVTDSIVVFVVRKGNPKNIKSWADLTKPGLQVINANPFTSGGARWNVMAAWGAQIKAHKTEKQANAYLTALYKNITVQDSSARASMNTFIGGKGDVLLAYENEAIQAQQAGADIQFVRPSATLLIENPIAVLKNTQHPTEANAFVDFTRSPAAQNIWATYGYRPIDKTVFKKWSKTFPVPRQLFTIRDIVKGGWPVVQPKFFDPNSGLLKQIQGGS
ncbi:MAG: sulfate/thiosulfate transport system substrate-binding protein [Gaiellales bacterium]|jgi:sulfate/thiosulfate-binding protein|nr:sulfate/thiosulfate transport system substrate-binding protein [Gaiellales bacterium]MDX6617909.1 sulfate/thiosulfate transport system substrate-binding protein [Gaiellales bacterium]